MDDPTMVDACRMFPAARDVAVDHDSRLSLVQAVALEPGVRVAVLRDDENQHYAAPVVDDAAPRRAVAGEGASEALVRALAHERGLGSGFTLVRWHGEEHHGESAVAVDQTNESIVVGDAAVVKWSLEVAPGPHPAPVRLATLVDAGFEGMPQPWGAVTWRASDDELPRLVAMVTEYLPGARDGWEWAVEDVRTAVSTGSDKGVRTAAERLGDLVGELHTALATAGNVEMTRDEAERLAAQAHAELDEAVRLTSGAEGRRLHDRADELHAVLESLRGAAGSPLIDVHGDLHVGQILRTEDRYAVIDFDGNPVLEPAERSRRQPVATDVAGMLQSLDNVGHVVVRRTEDVDPDAVSRLTRTARKVFGDAYRGALTSRDEIGLLDESLVLPLRIRQICREYLYAAKHLHRWLYVPDAALSGLEG